MLDMWSHKRYNSVYSIAEGRLIGAVRVGFVAVGKGIGVDLRESEDSCVQGCAASVCSRTQWSFLTDGEQDSRTDSEVGTLYSAWTNVGNDYYFSIGDG